MSLSFKGVFELAIITLFLTKLTTGNMATSHKEKADNQTGFKHTPQLHIWKRKQQKTVKL